MTEQHSEPMTALDQVIEDTMKKDIPWHILETLYGKKKIAPGEITLLDKVRHLYPIVR